MTERKQTEAALRESESRFRSLIKLVADFYWQTDTEHRFTVLEANGETQPEFSAASRLGRTRWEVPSIAPDAEGWRAHRAQLEARLPFRHFETAHLAADGSVRYYMVAGEPLFDTQGAFKGYWGVGREITERKRTEAALRESEENLAITLRSIGDAVLATDTEGRVTRMNPVAERLTGWSFAEAQSRPVAEVFRIVNEQTRAPAVVSVAQVLATGEHHGPQNHTLLLARDGTERPVADSAAPIRDADERVTGVVLVFRDVTAERQAERTIREQNERLEQRVRETTAQLSESEARYRSYFESSLDAQFLTTLDGSIVDVNAAACEMLGRPAEEIKRLGRNVVVDGTDPRLHAALEERARTGRVRAEITMLRSDGTKFPAEVASSVFTDAAGLPKTTMSIRDITERKHAEQEIQDLNASLERREGELRRAHEMARVTHVVTGPGGVFESWPDTLMKLIALGPDEMPRSTREWLAFLHPADRANFRAKAIEAAASNARVDVEYRLLRADGEWIHVRQAIEPMEELAGADRAAARWFNTLQDVSAQKHAEQKIRAQLEHLSLLDQITRSTGERLDLKSIFQIVLVRLEDSLPVDFGCVCLYDAVTNSLQVSCVGAKSEALARELTMGEQATIGIDANGLSRCVQGHLVYEPDIGEVRYPFPARLSRGGLGSLVLAPLKSESRVFGVLIVARRAANAFSSPECEFLRQLSEHVALAAHQAQLYGSLQQAYDDLRQTQAAVMQEERLRALGQMASGIAHDINNALSPVSLYVESLLETERELSARARGYLETIQRAVEDVAQTVARLREFYRKREQQLELAPVQMNAMVQQVLDLTRARWRDMPQERGIAIRALTELAPDLPEVMGVESEIREALTNLIFNAVDAMPEGGTLTLRTRVAESNPQPAAVAVEVVDTGAGMDEETRRRCLEPFFTTKGERGTGLGLAMVFGMVQRHSAEIEIDSAPGAGTTVRLVFAVPAAVQMETGAPTRVLEVPSRLRLLLIDDDTILLKSLQDTLQTDGHSIVTANGGEAGIAAFRAALARGEPYAAVITDLGMPYVDGRQVAAAVKESSRETPVILLTGWGQRLVAEGDIPPHVDRVLAKPPKLREVREALAQLCTGPQRAEKTA